MLARLVDVPEFAPAVAGLIGVGVGVDYALLVLTRFRTALARGLPPSEAVVEATATAGRSVLVAGGTVIVSLLGLFFVGVSYLRGVALAASLAVLVVMAASVTLLPALLGFAGRGVERLRLPALGRSPREDETTLSARWSRRIQRRPWLATTAGAAMLLVLATPVAGLRFGFPDEGNDRAAATTRQAYDLIAEGFGHGGNGPLIVVGPNVSHDAAARLQADIGVADATEPRRSPDGEIAAMTVIPAGGPQDEATVELVHRLRAAAPAGVEVGGLTAAYIDQSALIASRLPLFVGGVLIVSFLLLIRAFRAPLVALKAGVMNVLSIAAAYGVVALFAEGGRIGGIVGIDADTPVPPFVPVMMFAILFGLSMDYEVFLLSCVREEYLQHGDTGRAVIQGVAKAARVITAAAAIMVCVFLAFLLSDEIFLKLMGIGMATAVFVDATIVRMILVPAVMQLLGDANWWTPRWPRASRRHDAARTSVGQAIGESE